MSFISDDDIQKVREATDLVQVIGERAPVRRRGRDFWCCCPFHNEKTPSLKIDSANQLWHCFGCGEGGDLFGFIMKAEDVSFPDAVRYLAERAHIDIQETGGSGTSSSQKARLREVCAKSAEFFHVQLMRNTASDAAAARAYLASRGFGGEVPKRWKLGFAPGRGALVKHLRTQGFSFEEMLKANVAVSRGGKIHDRFYDRVIFPINDAQGDCIAFGGRVIGDGEPKYLNSQETPLFHKSNVLYGLDKAKVSMTATGTALVVEGYTDVIALHEHGITNAVATLGTALTMPHIRQLSRHASKRIVYLFDGDAAGQRAADRALEFISADMTPEAGKMQIELCAVTLPDNLDPAEYVERKGTEALRALLNDAQPLVLYGIKRRLDRHDLTAPEGRTRAFSDALSVLAPIKESLLAKDYAVQLASRLHVREDDALTALAALAHRAPSRDARTDAGGMPPARTKQRSAHTSASAPAPSTVHAPAADAAAADAAAAQALSSVPALSEAQKSRVRSERALLALFASNPTHALASADVLTSTHWHDATSAQIAEKLLEALSENPAISSAALVSDVSREVPAASRILTAARVPEGTDVGVWKNYLIEELQIGDLEEQVAAMNASLSEGNLSAEDQDLIFHTLVDAQNQLNAKRAHHNPPFEL